MYVVLYCKCLVVLAATSLSMLVLRLVLAIWTAVVIVEKTLWGTRITLSGHRFSVKTIVSSRQTARDDSIETAMTYIYIYVSMYIKDTIP